MCCQQSSYTDNQSQSYGQLWRVLYYMLPGISFDDDTTATFGEALHKVWTLTGTGNPAVMQCGVGSHV